MDKENFKKKYSHIKGWGVDSNPQNDPTHPNKKSTGNDHSRLNYKRPLQQDINIEILHSNERPNVSAVFGTSVPPSGLSGVLRRIAFKYSESSYAHWLPLILADRVNVFEGIISDIRHGKVPNFFVERGWKSEWKYNRKNAIKKIVITFAVTSAIVALFTLKNKKLKRIF